MTPGKTLKIPGTLAFAQNAEYRHHQQLLSRDPLEVADQVKIS